MSTLDEATAKKPVMNTATKEKLVRFGKGILTTVVAVGLTVVVVLLYFSAVTQGTPSLSL